MKDEIIKIINDLRDNAIFQNKEDCPEDDIEDRYDWEELHYDFDRLYYALIEIENIVKK